MIDGSAIANKIPQDAASYCCDAAGSEQIAVGRRRA